MVWLSCLLLLALSGVAFTQAVQPVRNLQAFGATKRGVSYTFTASPTSGASYKVTFIPQRTGIPQPPTETFTSASLRTKSGLVPDVNYTIQVVAVKGGVESTAVTTEFTTLPDVPTGSPQGLAVASRTTTSITVTWRDPAPDRINDRDGVTGFVVRRDVQQVATVTDRTYTFTGLTVATSYRLEVLAVNEQGTAPDNHAARLTATTASGVPNPPALRVVLPRFSNTYLVWRDPEPFVGDILGVQIRYLIDCIPQSIPEQGIGIKHYSVSGIKSSAGKTHSISVRARTSAGCGTFSAPVVFTFQPIAEVEVAAVSCDKLKLSYTVNPLPSGSRDTTLQSLVVRYQAILRGSPQSRTIPLNGSATEGVLCISGLASDTGYRITYSVEVNIGSLPSDVPEPIEVSTGGTCNQRQQCQESKRTRTTTTTPPPTSCTMPPPPSCPRPPVITPSTPQPTRTSSTTMTTTTARPTAQTGVQPVRNLQAFGARKRGVSYTFTASRTSGASYKVNFIPQRAGIPQPLTETFTSASLRTKSGLVPDVRYRIQVVAMLNGVNSTVVTTDFTTQPDVPTGPPQGLTVASRTTTSITVTWGNPTPDRINDRDGVTGFVVRRDGQQVATVTVRTYTFTGLSVATSYRLEVLAVNEQGTAPDNHAARLTATTVSGVPNRPALRVVLPRFSNTYLLWRDPEPYVGDILGVQIRYLIDGVSKNIPQQDSGNKHYSVSGIKNSVKKRHSISLRARTSAGWGQYSTPIQFTFRPIAEVEVTPGCDTLNVNYTVNSLPDGENNAASLSSLVVSYQRILGGGDTRSRSVALNGRAAQGVLKITGLSPDTAYRVTYKVEIAVSFQVTLPSDIADPIELHTTRTCPAVCTSPCQNGGTCTAPNTCTCAPGWRGSQCTTAVDCGNPGTPSKGQRSGSSTTYNSVVTYTCNTGYTLTQGSNRRTCQSNGQWSGSLPRCNPVNCGDPGTPRNGRRTGSSTTYNFVVTYTCNTGYTLQGTNRRTCQSNGQWSGSLPRCNPVNCGDPGTPSNGQRTGSSTTYNSVVTYTCNTGYRLEGSSRITCQSNGQWSGSLPRCIPISTSIQPPSNLQTSDIRKRRVSYRFAASPTSGVTYKVIFSHQRAGIPRPTTDTFDSVGLRTKSGLVPDVTYTIQVVAVNGGEESAASSVTFTTKPDVPTGPPLDLAVAGRNATSITVTWREPAPDRINDRDGVTGFVMRRDGQQVATVTDLTYTFTGLQPATNYTFEVLAVNEQGLAKNRNAAKLTASTTSSTTTRMPDGGMCPDEVDNVWGIQWPDTTAGSSLSVSCVKNNEELGMANRLCNGSGVWDTVDAVDCESAAGNEIKMKTDRFVTNLKDPNATLSPDERIVFRRISQDLNTALQPDNKPIPPQDLRTVASFVEVVAVLGENNGLFNEESNETQQLIGDILSKVFDDENAPAFEAFAQRSSSGDLEAKRTALATSILRSSERVASAIAKTINNNAITVSRPNLAMVVQRFSINSLIRSGNGLNWKPPIPFVPPTLFNKTESLPVIHFPPSFLIAARRIKVPSENDSVVVVNMVMNNIGNYLPTDVDREVEAEDISPASLVLSSQILGYDGGEVDSSETVTMIFPINKEAQDLQVPPDRVKQFRCAFFTFSGGAEQTGAWSCRGVETVIINETHVQCTSSHLTSFVVLVMTVPAPQPLSQLDSIIYIGCAIAFLCLLACIIFYVIFVRKDLFRKLHNFVHFNLCIALSLGLLLFIFGIQLATANTTACKVVTALMHYFFLATFTWTLCEAVLICFLLVKVFGANNMKWIFLYLTLGWALPVPVVVLTGGIRHDYYLIRSSFDQDHPHYDNIKACWFPTVNGMIFAFIVPMALIIVVNAVLLAVSLLSLATSQFGMITKEKRNEESKRNVNTGKCLLMTNIIIVPVLVFTWIMGLFAVEGQEKIYAILFVLANVLQGLFILLLYVVLHEKVFKWIKGRRSNSKMRVTTGGGSTKGGAPSVTWMDKDDTGGSCTVDKKNAIEFEEKQKDEDEGSIQGEDVDTAN